VLYSYDGKIEHYHIKYENNEYTIDDEDIFESLTQLVEHYQKDSDGLVTRLRLPIKKKSGKVEYSVNSEDFMKSKLKSSGESGEMGEGGGSGGYIDSLGKYGTYIYKVKLSVWGTVVRWTVLCWTS